MTALDAVFVRMGAKDNLAGGQSTFMVELSETGAMLRRATTNSLVALDELGRGTATADGTAIACAVASHLIDKRCRTLFSTHYHRLADDHARDPHVALAHMACRVETPSGAGVETLGRETVTFLYTLASGNCPRSYGVNVARLAGLPESVCLAAARRAAHLEAGQLEKLVGDERSRERVVDACREVLRDVSAADLTEPNVRRAQDKARTAL
jgi:DNA mismatch repair protein MSH6